MQEVAMTLLRPKRSDRTPDSQGGGGDEQRGDDAGTQHFHAAQLHTRGAGGIAGEVGGANVEEGEKKRQGAAGKEYFARLALD